MKKLFASLLFCFAFFAQAVILEWDANSETNLAGYRAYYGSQSRVYTTVVDVGNFTTVTLPTLPGTTFYAVTAYDSDGLESEFSDEVFYAAPTLRLSVEGDFMTWTADPRAVRYEIYSGWSPDKVDNVQWLEPQHLRMHLIQNPARKYYRIAARYADGSASELSPEVSWDFTAPEPKVAPRMLNYPLPAGRWLVESTFAFGDPTAWIPFDEVTGPIDFQIAIDTSVPAKYFKAISIP